MAHRSQEIALGLGRALDFDVQANDRIVLQRHVVRILENELPFAVQAGS